MSTILNRQHFGLPADPCTSLDLDTIDSQRAGDLVRAAVEAQAFVSILGPAGSGKTRAVRQALTQDGVRVVEPIRLGRERMHIGDIETALVRDLSDERPRRSGEARSHQVRRILGAASRERPVVLTLDDGHLVHGQTLRALKRLRELTWLGRAPLLGVVLIGQMDRLAGIRELDLRSDRLWLAGLTASEVRVALGGFRAALEESAVERICASHAARNWLELQRIVDLAIAEAIAQGARRVTGAHLAAILPAAPGANDVADDVAILAHLQGAATRKIA